MKNYINDKIFIFIFIILVVGSCKKQNNTDNSGDNDSPNQSLIQPKVLLIGLDGVMFDKFLEKLDPTTMPNLSNFKFYTSYTGGIVGSNSRAVTLSGPGWSTILTGTWLWKHGVFNNRPPLESKVSSIFKYIKDKYPNYLTSSSYGWGALKRFFINDSKYIDFNNYTVPIGETYIESDRASFQFTNDLLNSNPDIGFLFLHLARVDEVGHKTGIGKDYLNTIVEVDNYVEQLISSVNSRKSQYQNEDWLIIVTTDHGKDDVGNHGRNSLNEKKSFIGLNKVPNQAIMNRANNPNIIDPLNENLYDYAAQTDIVPSILNFLNISIPASEYIFDGTSGFGNIGVNKLKVLYNNKTKCIDLSWVNYSVENNVNIYRNKTLIEIKKINVNKNISYYSDCNNVNYELLKTYNYVIESNNSKISSKVW